jgi:hypothetical protein
MVTQIARLEGFEPTTPGSEDRCSCPLSYRRTIAGLAPNLSNVPLPCRSAASDNTASSFLTAAS